MPASPIDRDKLRVFVRRLESDELLELVDRAIKLLPKTKLPKFIKGYARPPELRPDGPSAADVLHEV